jgi:hypothetical protein
VFRPDLTIADGDECGRLHFVISFKRQMLYHLFEQLPPNLTATHFLDEFLETQGPHGTQTRRCAARTALSVGELSEGPLTAMLHRVTMERTLEMRALNIHTEIHHALAIAALARAEVRVHVHRIFQITYPASFWVDRTRLSSPSRALVSEFIATQITFTRY